MANAQTKASAKYQKKVGIIAKSYKIKKELANEFKDTCNRLGVGQSAIIGNLMQEFINKNS